MSAKGITDELVQQVADDLRARYGLYDEGMRALGSRLADSTGAPSAENLEFAKRFTESTARRSPRSPSRAAQMPPRW